MTATLEDIIRAARAVPVDAYDSHHLRALARVDPGAVVDVLERAQLTGTEREELAVRLGVSTADGRVRREPKP